MAVGRTLGPADRAAPGRLAVNPAEYETMYQVEDRHWWYESLHTLLDTSLRRYAPEGPLRLLDIGCGTGASLQRMERHGEAFGLDIAPPALACCRRRWLHRLCQASALNLPYADNTFDAAALLDVLYHRQVSDPRVPLQEARRVLRPGGLLLVNVPAYQWLYSSHDEAVHTARRFTRGELRGLFRDTGLETIYASYWNTLLFPPIAAVRLVRRLRPPQGSDLEGAGDGRINEVLKMVLAVERALMGVMPLPFGLSVFAVARKPGPR